MTIVILYEEMAPYFQSCISRFIELYDAKVYIFCNKINSVAPFEFENKQLEFYYRDNWTKTQIIKFIEEVKPDGIYYGGWASKEFVNIAKHFKGQTVNIVAFDNKWSRSVKQSIVNFIYPVLITRYFDQCFVPGVEQVKYAKSIGFREEQITTGVYSCDFDFFESLRLDFKSTKKISFPKRLLYVGRYDKSKGLKDLWKSFIQFQKENPNEWELWCIGTGDLKPVSHPKIIHFGFVQPKDFSDIVEKTGVFVLPSHYEPWGVVIHEFCTAGYPIICSDQVGSRTQFVENGQNGYIFKAKNTNKLFEIFNTINSIPEEELIRMSEVSFEKAKGHTPEIWANKLSHILTHK
jgi:glycosyltransferase involved in cell wall biosynthesis